MITIFLKLIIILGGIPFLYGLLISSIFTSKRKKIGLGLSTYSMGYLLYFGSLEIQMLLLYFRVKDFSLFTHYLYQGAKVQLMVLIIACSLVVLIKRQKIVVGSVNIIKSSQLLAVFLLTLVSVPNFEDKTIAIVNSVKEFNVIQMFNPYTKEVGEIIPVYKLNFVEFWYGYVSKCTDVGTTTLVEYVIPIFYSLFILGIFYQLAKILCIKVKYDSVFVSALILFYGTQLLIDGSLEVSLFRNIWNGRALFVGIVIPLVVSLGYRFLLDMFSQKSKLSIKLKWIVFQMALALPGTFLLSMGYLYIVLLVVVTVVICIILQPIFIRWRTE